MVLFVFPLCWSWSMPVSNHGVSNFYQHTMYSTRYCQNLSETYKQQSISQSTDWVYLFSYVSKYHQNTGHMLQVRNWFYHFRYNLQSLLQADLWHAPSHRPLSCLRSPDN